MRLLIFGATGKTGQCFVDQALQRGHVVTAFVRDPAKLAPERDNLHLVQGDILEPASVEAAFGEPFDAVISALGVFHREDRTELSAGTRNIIAAMQKHGCRRLAVVSSLGAGDSAGHKVQEAAERAVQGIAGAVGGIAIFHVIIVLFNDREI